MIIMFVYAGIPVLQLRLLARVAVHRDLEGPEIVFYEEFPVSFCGCKEGHIAGVHPSIGILGLIGYGIGHYAVARIDIIGIRAGLHRDTAPVYAVFEIVEHPLSEPGLVVGDGRHSEGHALERSVTPRLIV